MNYGKGLLNSYLNYFWYKFKGNYFGVFLHLSYCSAKATKFQFCNFEYISLNLFKDLDCLYLHLIDYLSLRHCFKGDSYERDLLILFLNPLCLNGEDDYSIRFA